MKQKRFSPRDFQAVFALILPGLLLASLLVFLNWKLADRYGTGADLLPAWNGARAFLFENTDPYSRTVAEWTQVDVYGRAARAGEYPYMLDMPFPLLVLFLLPLFIYRLLAFLIAAFPFWISSLPIPDAKWFLWVRALWMTASELGLFVLVTMALRLADWRPKFWFTLLLLLFSLTWFYSLAALFDASFSILLALALVGALIAMRDFNDELAGVLLAISAVQWDATLLLWLFLIIAALTARRWRVFAGMGMTWFVLGVVSFFFYPDWIWPWLRGAAANGRADEIFTPALILQTWLPDSGARLWLVIGSIFLLILVIEWFSALRSQDFRRVAWVFALALAFTPLLGFSNSLANLAPLAFSFVYILPFAWERWKKYPYLILTLISILFFAFPFLLRLPDLASRLPADGLAFLVPPIVVIVGLYWIRWYVIRPPRTWLDGVKRELHK